MKPNIEQREIIDAITANGGKVIDDATQKAIDVKYVGLFGGVCVQLIPGTNHSVHMLRLDDEGKPHLSRRAIGGTVLLETHTIDEAIRDYNESVKHEPLKLDIIDDVVQCFTTTKES